MLDYKIDETKCAKLLFQSLLDPYYQPVINLTNNFLTDYLVFNDVAATFFEEESRHKNKVDRLASS